MEHKNRSAAGHGVEPKTAKILWLVALVALVSSTMTEASAPGRIRYQAQLSDNGGIPLTGTHTLAFGLYGSETTDEGIWSCQLEDYPITNGFVDLVMPLHNPAAGENWPNCSGTLTAAELAGDRWLEIMVDGTELTPRQQLASVPYAIVADTAASLQMPSSKHLKQQIRPLADSLAIVGELRGVRFDWKASGVSDIGFIAEEVAAVLPEIVGRGADGESVRTVDPTRIIPVLVEAIKAQQRQIDALTSALEQSGAVAQRDRTDPR